MLHLRRLSYFVAVLDHHTLVSAAQVLHIAQPALSRQIRILESELGLALFTRDRGRLVPTPGALRLGSVARALLAQVDLGERAAASIRAGRVEQLICVSTRATAQAVLAPFIMTMRDDDPLLITREVAHGDVEGALSEGADFAISPLPPSRLLASRRIDTFPVLAVVGLEHRWAREQRVAVKLAELVGETLLVPPRSSISRQELDRSLRVAGLSLGSHVVCEIELTALALAARGRGVAVTTSPQSVECWAMPIIDAPGNSPVMSLYACWQHNHYAAETLASIAERLERFVHGRDFHA